MKGWDAGILIGFGIVIGAIVCLVLLAWTAPEHFWIGR